MIDEPVAKASENSTKPNSAVAQRVRSAASREPCMPTMAAWARNSTRKSRSATASMLLALGPLLPRAGATGSRAGAERHHVDSRAAVAEPLPVALEHEHVGEQVMGQEYRLGPLQVGV